MFVSRFMNHFNALGWPAQVWSDPAVLTQVKLPVNTINDIRI